MKPIFDIAIIGSGISGASAAYFLSPYRSVILLEKETQSGYHATGRTAAEFTERFHSPVTMKLTSASYDFMTKPPSGFSDIDILKKRGNLIIGRKEKADHIREVYNSISRETSGLHWLSTEEALALAPILKEEYIGGAFLDENRWDIDVDALLQGYLRGARSHGTVLRTQFPVQSIRFERDFWTIETEGKTVRAKTIVNAAGAWADEIAALGNIMPVGLKSYRRTVIIVDIPESLTTDHMPAIAEVDDEFYFKPETGKLLACPSDETESPPCDAQPEEIDIAYAAHYLDEVTSVRVKSIGHKWAGLRTFSPDREPVIGFSSAVQGFFWLVGQGGSGVQMSPAVGEATASLIMKGSLPQHFHKYGISESDLSPSRFINKVAKAG